MTCQYASSGCNDPEGECIGLCMQKVATSDRELLELAAKAAGYEIEGDADKLVVQPGRFSGGFSILNHLGGSSLWNPLTDDGDALRLAVKLGMFFSPEFSHFLSLERFAGQERDDCNAHRRAIVRAAAEIGKVQS